MTKSLMTTYFNRILHEEELQDRLRKIGPDFGSLVEFLKELQVDTSPSAFRVAAAEFSRLHQLDKLELNEQALIRIPLTSTIKDEDES